MGAGVVGVDYVDIALAQPTAYSQRVSYGLPANWMYGEILARRPARELATSGADELLLHAKLAQFTQQVS